ncbi:IS3 family transposase [Enorma phocaeensis]|uniref:IS3 family transposase n=1 Tax=Enorma phocaeensis TaxID=1871019 RepID=UPI0023578E3C|nr:IS3 family transposase [Enorma phocaeensis]
MAQLPAVQLRRLLMHAVAQLPVREIDLRDLQAKLSDYVHRCNNFRIHSTLGYMSPVEFRKAGLILSKPSK